MGILYSLFTIQGIKKLTTNITITTNSIIRLKYTIFIDYVGIPIQNPI